MSGDSGAFIRLVRGTLPFSRVLSRYFDTPGAFSTLPWEPSRRLREIKRFERGGREEEERREKVL